MPASWEKRTDNSLAIRRDTNKASGQARRKCRNLLAATLNVPLWWTESRSAQAQIRVRKSWNSLS